MTSHLQLHKHRQIIGICRGTRRVGDGKKARKFEFWRVKFAARRWLLLRIDSPDEYRTREDFLPQNCPHYFPLGMWKNHKSQRLAMIMISFIQFLELPSITNMIFRIGGLVVKLAVAIASYENYSRDQCRLAPGSIPGRCNQFYLLSFCRFFVVVGQRESCELLVL
jgi:hypothetical protein